MIVTVTVPGNALPDDTRGIVRLAIANGLELNPALRGGVKLKSVRPAARIVEAARKAWEAWGGGPKGRAKAQRLPLIDYIEGREA